LPQECGGTEAVVEQALTKPVGAYRISPANRADFP